MSDTVKVHGSKLFVKKDTQSRPNKHTQTHTCTYTHMHVYDDTRAHTHTHTHPEAQRVYTHLSIYPASTDLGADNFTCHRLKPQQERRYKVLRRKPCLRASSRLHSSVENNTNWKRREEACPPIVNVHQSGRDFPKEGRRENFAQVTAIGLKKCVC